MIYNTLLTKDSCIYSNNVTITDILVSDEKR